MGQRGVVQRAVGLNWWIIGTAQIGTILMRSAGCAINDWADRRFDAHVKRTAQRPLAAGEIAPGEALAVAAVLAFLCIPCRAADQCDDASCSCCPRSAIAAAYPFFKRFFALPQAFLGIAFSFGIPMAFAAVFDILYRVTEMDQQKTEFFSNASHELRTPLTLMLAPLESLATRQGLPAEAADDIKSVLRGGYRLLKLVNDLLDLSKLEAGKMKLPHRPADLTRLLNEVVRPWLVALSKRGVEVELLLPQCLLLTADAERLEQVALNLISNAVKHVSDKGFIRVEARQGEGEVEFSITNSGRGLIPDISPAVRPLRPVDEVALAALRLHRPGAAGGARIGGAARRPDRRGQPAGAPGVLPGGAAHGPGHRRGADPGRAAS